MATIEEQKKKLAKALSKLHPDAGLAEDMRQKYRELEELEKLQTKKK